MKKTISLLAAITIITLSACGGNASVEKTDNSTSESVQKAESQSIIESESMQKVEETEDKSQSRSEEYDGYIENGIFVITGCNSEDENIIVPDEIDGSPVEIIAKSAFFEAPCKHVTLPDSLKTISEYAFINCQSLETVDFGNGLETVGYLAFTGCKNLKEVSFPGSLSKLELAFAMCESLKEVYIPATTTEVSKIANLDTCPNIVIVTPSGSAAEAEAIRVGLPVKNS